MTARLSPQREAEIAARAEAASPSPWFLHKDWPGRVFSESEFNHHIARVTGTNPERNEAFIAHAREDVPALLAELAAVRAERDEARTALRGAADQVAERDDEVGRLGAVLAAETSAHRFTLQQRNNRSNRIMHLRELAHAAASGDASAIEALIAAARDTLAASRDDHANCASEEATS